MAKESIERPIRLVGNCNKLITFVTPSWTGETDKDTGKLKEYEITIDKLHGYKMHCTCMDAVCRRKNRVATLADADPRTDGAGCKHIKALLVRLRR